MPENFAIAELPTEFLVLREEGEVIAAFEYPPTFAFTGSHPIDFDRFKGVILSDNNRMTKWRGDVAVGNVGNGEVDIVEARFVVKPASSPRNNPWAIRVINHAQFKLEPVPRAVGTTVIATGADHWKLTEVNTVANTRVYDCTFTFIDRRELD